MRACLLVWIIEHVLSFNSLGTKWLWKSKFRLDRKTSRMRFSRIVKEWNVSKLFNFALNKILIFLILFRQFFSLLFWGFHMLRRKQSLGKHLLYQRSHMVVKSSTCRHTLKDTHSHTSHLCKTKHLCTLGLSLPEGGEAAIIWAPCLCSISENSKKFAQKIPTSFKGL